MDAARLLLLSGAKANLKNQSKQTALDIARESRASDVIHLLELFQKVTPAKANVALREALGKHNHKTKKILDAVAAGADDVTMRDNKSRTALHWAAQENEPELVLHLLQKGADASAKDNWGNTPLMLASQKGCTDVEEVLRTWKSNHSTPLASAASREVASSISIEESEANLPTVNPNEQLQKALGSQGRYKPDNILRAIRGGATNFSFTDQLGRTALHWAAMKDDIEAAQIALAKGADPDASNNSQQTPLDLAAENGFKEVTALLANAQLQAALSLGQGRFKGESKSERILRTVRSGVTDFSLTDKFGRTALHWAAMKDDVKAAEIALKGGADPHAISGAKQTPLALAKASNATKVVALLSAPAKAAAPSAQPTKATEQTIVVTPPAVTKASSSETAANKKLQEALTMAGGGNYKAKGILSAIRGGATNFSIEGQGKMTALHWAAKENDVEAVRIALDFIAINFAFHINANFLLH